MSEKDMKPVSAQTGTFSTLRTASEAREGGSKEPATGKDVPELEASEMANLVATMNVTTRAIGRDLRFQVNMDTGQSVIQVLDRETGEIVRQIPPEKSKLYVADSGEVVFRLYDDKV